MHDHLAADPKVLGGQAEWQQCSPEAGHPLALAPRLQGPGDSGGRLRVRQVHSMHRVQRWPDAPTQTLHRRPHAKLPTLPGLTGVRRRKTWFPASPSSTIST